MVKILVFAYMVLSLPASVFIWTALRAVKRHNEEIPNVSIEIES